MTRHLDEGFENWGVFASYDEGKNAINEYAKERHAIIENETNNIFKLIKHKTCRYSTYSTCGKHEHTYVMSIEMVSFGYLVKPSY